MAAMGLLALIDDVATLLDDVALLTKTAAGKTAGVLGDDLALNAEQVSGVQADRELAVVWAVAKGSALNKLILVPVALLISAFAHWLIMPLLMLGGAYLCIEGAEKIVHHFFADREQQQHQHAEMLNAISNPAVDIVEFEKDKIKGAIRTDFILSAEIVVIVLGVVQAAPLLQQIFIVSLLAALITIVVYGVVAAIVKLDDLGLYLLRPVNTRPAPRIKAITGQAILAFCPYLMKTLSVVGTLAMFMVGGGILFHGIPWVADGLHALAELLAALFWAPELLVSLLAVLINGVAGFLAGLVLLAGALVIKRGLAFVKSA